MNIRFSVFFNNLSILIAILGRGERKGSVMELPRRKFDHNGESEDEDKWR